jgi:hypothetical protein
MALARQTTDGEPSPSGLQRRRCSSRLDLSLERLSRIRAGPVRCCCSIGRGRESNPETRKPGIVGLTCENISGLVVVNLGSKPGKPVIRRVSGFGIVKPEGKTRKLNPLVIRCFAGFPGFRVWFGGLRGVLVSRRACWRASACLLPVRSSRCGSWMRGRSRSAARCLRATGRSGQRGVCRGL